MKLCILDKDGTIVQTKSGHKFVQHPEDQELFPGVAERIAQMKADGWTFAIASNQGGVAAGYKTVEDVVSEMQYACFLIGIHKAYFCPCDSQNDNLCMEMSTTDGSDFWDCQEWGSTGGRGGFRKPAPGMLQLAILSQISPLTDVLMIGDREEDRLAAENAGIRFLDAEAWRGGAIV